MRMTEDGRRVVLAWAIGLGVAIASPGAASVQQVPTFEVWDFGVFPRPSVESVLLSLEPVRRDLKITDAQKKAQDALMERRLGDMQRARRDIKDDAKFRAARDAIIGDFEAAYQASFTPEQHERLDQIQLQAQGPLAFGPPDFPAAYAGAPLADRLMLSEDQIRRVREIAETGAEEIRKAASFPIPLGSKEKPPGEEAVRKLVESPEFQDAKAKARRAGKDAWAGVIRRIEGILTDSQREAYRRLLGVPFDFSSLASETPEAERQDDIGTVTRAFRGGGGGGGGQRADPGFDTKVARPAYLGEATRPRVLFDEAHHNFHTSGGRYKPFAELIGNDGYRVLPNRETFSADSLRSGDILVIANALGAGGMGQAGASSPAFTDAECDAVRDWVREGGSLLFITDHAPMGAAAECLARRFGIDLSKGATSDPVNSEGGDTSLVFSRQNRLLGDHPITRGRNESERVNRVQTFTGTSMKGPEGAVVLYQLADTALDNPFDGEGRPTSAAGRAQGLALGLGKGRVVVLGEAAEMSAQLIGDEKFGMNVPGLDNRQMALNIMHWLSGLLEPRSEARR